MWPYSRRPGSRIIYGANRFRRTKSRRSFPEQKRTRAIAWGRLSTRTAEKKTRRSEGSGEQSLHFFLVLPGTVGRSALRQGRMAAFQSALGVLRQEQAAKESLLRRLTK